MGILCYMIGKVCRSPMAEFLLNHITTKYGIADDFYIVSAATSTEEIGNPVHYGTRRKLAQYGIRTDGKTAFQLRTSDYEKYDYFIGMDSANIRNMTRILKGDPEGKIYKMLSFAGSERDVADPWYTGDFEATFEDIMTGLEAFLKELPEYAEVFQNGIIL